MDSLLNQQDWYVLFTYPGYEHRVQASLQQRVRERSMHGQVTQVIALSEPDVHSACVVVQMDLSSDAWELVSKTPGVTGFVGSRDEPAPHRLQVTPKA